MVSFEGLGGGLGLLGHRKHVDEHLLGLELRSAENGLVA